MWSLAALQPNGTLASQVHPLSSTIVGGKNVNSSIRSLEWENKVTWQLIRAEQDDRSMKQRTFTWHTEFCNGNTAISVKE